MARTGIKEVIKNNNLWENQYLGYVGSLDERKRVKDIIYALKEVKDKGLKLLIIGGKTQEEIDRYLELAHKLGLEDRVEVTGWISRKEMEEHLKRVKIGVVPLEDTFFNRNLTSPMKIFNYFSYGIPIKGSKLPTVEEIVTEQGGIFYENGNLEELVGAIDRLNSSKEVFDSYSQYILERAEGLLWEKRGEKIIEFLDSVIG